MSTTSITQADLAHFTGTERWFRHGLVRHILYTEGMQFVAEKAGAYWLLDEIAFSQREVLVAAEGFQVWTLEVDEAHRAVLTCEDGNDRVILKRKLAFTDFPFTPFVVYCTDHVILLPSEY